MRVKSIGLVCPFEGKVSPRLLEGLAEWSGVQFRELLRPDPANVDGLIVVTRDPGAAVASFLNSPVPTLLVAEPGTVSDREDVRFAGIDKVDQSLRGVTLPEPGGDLPAAMSDTLGGEVLAFKGSRAAWIHWSCSGGGLDLALCPPPAIPARGYLHDHFGTTRFLSLLPWLDFVRRVRGSDGWEPETRQACIVFDDPSLYRPRYGYVDFEALAQHASAHHHHVSIATVPLDLLGASRRTAAIFREHRSVLSLLVHGNNHLSREMARPGSPQTRLQMAGQIIRRAQRFENTHGVTIGRVMEAPHATFVPATFPALLAVGFEAAMVTPDLLQHDPGSAPWPAAFGLAGDGEFGGLPWIPRIRWRQGWHTDVLLAAFLRQPMVVAGHHNDIRDGLEAMGEIANTINRQGEVTWSPTDELVRRRARRRIEGETLFVKTYAVRATISVPEGIRSLVLERGGPTGSFAGPITVSQEGQTIASLASSDPVVGPISVRGRGEVSVLRTVPKAVGPDDVPAPRTSVWPVIRKVIMEVRDRSQPVRHRATRRRSRPATAVPVSGGA